MKQSLTILIASFLVLIFAARWFALEIHAKLKV